MIQRVLTLLILLSLQLFARQYDNTLLDSEAKLFPKIAMLEKNIKNKNSAVLSLVIVSKKIDFSIAKKLKLRILKNYPNKILNKKVNVRIKRINQLSPNNIDALIVLSHPKKATQALALWTNQNNILSFSYDASDLDNGIVASIYIGKTTKPYINKRVLQKHNFSFDSYLLQVSKFKE